MNITHKIKEIQRYYNLSIRELADRSGVGRGAIQTYVKEGPDRKPSAPSIDAVLSILKAFPEINTDWFLFDEGEMIKKNNVQAIDNKTEPATIVDTSELSKKYTTVLEDLNEARKELIECLKGHPEGLPPLRPTKKVLG